MKRNRYLTQSKLAVLAIAAGTLLMASCAVDGYDDETFSGGVTGQTLASPAADSITFTANADGSRTIISWPVVIGAQGYLCSVYNVTDPANPIAIVADSLVDGTSLTVNRAEDSNYTFSIQTIGNTALNNGNAAEATQTTFTSFQEAFATIPDGADIAEWLAQNTLPEDQGEIILNLEDGGSYTLNSNATFGNNPITFRTASTNRATITMGADASFIIKDGFRLKNVIIDGSQCTNPVILMNKEPNEATKNLKSDRGYYYIENTVSITNCLIDNLTDEFVNSNGVGYCIETFLIDNCVFHFNTASGHSTDTYFNMYNSGCINYFTARYSTFYNSSSNNMNYFLRYNNAGGPDRTGYSEASVTFRQCTFYNIVKSGQICNYQRMGGNGNSRRLVTFTLDRNIVVNSGNRQFARRFLGGATWENAENKSFTYNTYFFNGEDAWTMPDPNDETTWTGEVTYDRSGTIISGDPGFADPDNGNFTVSGANQIAAQNGDPRWLN